MTIWSIISCNPPARRRFFYETYFDIASTTARERTRIQLGMTATRVSTYGTGRERRCWGWRPATPAHARHRPETDTGGSPLCHLFWIYLRSGICDDVAGSVEDRGRNGCATRGLNCLPVSLQGGTIQRFSAREWPSNW